MHEYSLVRGLLLQMHEAAAPHQDTIVDEVVVAIGPLSGVEPMLVAIAFENLTLGTPYSTTRLVIEQTPLELSCLTCECAFETLEVALACPSCKSARTRVIQGDEVVLRQLVLRELQPEESAS